MTYSDAVKIGETQSIDPRINIEREYGKEREIKYEEAWDLNKDGKEKFPILTIEQLTLDKQTPTLEAPFIEPSKTARNLEIPESIEIPLGNRYTSLIPLEEEERMLYPLIKARKRKREDEAETKTKEIGSEEQEGRKDKRIDIQNEHNQEEDEHQETCTPTYKDGRVAQNEKEITDIPFTQDETIGWDDQEMTDIPSTQNEITGWKDQEMTDTTLGRDEIAGRDDKGMIDTFSSIRQDEIEVQNENLRADTASEEKKHEMRAQDGEQTLEAFTDSSGGSNERAVGSREQSSSGTNIPGANITLSDQNSIQDTALDVNTRANEALLHRPRGRLRTEKQTEEALQRLSRGLEENIIEEDISDEQMHHRWDELMNDSKKSDDQNKMGEGTPTHNKEVRNVSPKTTTLNLKINDLSLINKNERFEVQEPESSKAKQIDTSKSLDHYDEFGNDIRQNDPEEEPEIKGDPSPSDPCEEETKESNMKIKAICRQCHSSTCEQFKQKLTMLSIDKTVCNPIESCKHQVLTPIGRQGSLRNLWETHKWPIRHDDNQIREQPHFQAKKGEGARYSVVIIINNTILDAQIDSGSFASCMSKRMAQKLGLHVKESEPIWAKTASGRTQFCHTTHAQTDFGTFSADITYSIATDESWDILLIGSSTLEALKANINFEKSIMRIMGAFTVRMFQGPVESRKYMMTIKTTQISLSAIKLQNDKLIRLPPNSKTEVTLFVERLEAVALENTYTFFEGKQLTNGVRSADLLIDAKFPWRTKPLRLNINNYSEEHKIIFLDQY